MTLDKSYIDVMVSSTTSDLDVYRQQVGEIISTLQMIPHSVDLNVTTDKDGLTYALELIDNVALYILLVGFRYGYVPIDQRNPKHLSITQLEYERALEREARGELCILPFVMSDDHLRFAKHVESDPDKFREQEAFRKVLMARNHITFDDADTLAERLEKILRDSEYVRQARATAPPSQAFIPHMGVILEGRYVFIEKLGQGGNGEVWKVHERLPDGSSNEVAIKLLKPDVSENSERIARFQKEISVACRLSHPNIIRTLHWGEIGSQFFAVMDYVQGQTLRDFISGRAFTDRQTVYYLRQVAEALDAAHFGNHDLKVVHRDVKPENILVKNNRLRLGDFGLVISPEENDSISQTGEWIGTKKYMAPEQWDNQPTTPQTDIYALSIIAYEMLTGEFPYDDSSHARLMEQHLHQKLPPHNRLSDEMLRILHRGTAKHPGDRYPSATAFIQELAHWQDDPANLETKIQKYLNTLYTYIKGERYQRFAVTLKGDIHQLLPPAPPPLPEDAHLASFVDDSDPFNHFTITLEASHKEAPEKEATPVTNILKKLTQCQRVVLVGEPGSGKTFTLWQLAMYYAHQYPKLQRIPVFVPLNAFKGVDTKGQTQPFTDYIKFCMGELGHHYHQLYDEGRLVLLCDALNEMPLTAPDSDWELLPEVRETLETAALFVVSCRVRDYTDDLNDLDLECLEIHDMDYPTIQEFFRKYLGRDNWLNFWERIGGSDDLTTFWEAVYENKEPERFWQEAADVPNYTTKEGDAAWKRMWQGAKLIPLARNPYLALVICTLHRQRKLPSNRYELYAAFIEDLYNREQHHAHQRQESFPPRGDLEAFLTELATQMQMAQTTVLKCQPIAENAALLRAAQDATILTRDNDNLRFTHQLLQEYFAVKTLAVTMYNGEVPPALAEGHWWQTNTWRETALMLAEFTEDVEQVARWIGQVNPWLAAETLQIVNETESLENTLPETRLALAQSAHAKRNEANPVGRAAAYRVLGLFGDKVDKRPGVGLHKGGLPRIVWCKIPPGTYPIGGDAEAYESLDNQIFTSRQGYWLAKYPITYLQFQAFIEAEDGFNHDEWWADMPENHRKQPLRIQCFRFANHPRDNVSWYQAVAFCRWLNARYEGMLPEGWQIRLPTEYEWEAAARGSLGLLYPYGNNFDSTKGNTIETRLNQTCAVGIFPTGASPYAVLDMSGNVWEWCLNTYSNPKNGNISSTARRVMRGGSWYYYQSSARAASRFKSLPFNQFNYAGFRIAAGQARY